MNAACTKCGVEKPLDEYHRDKKGRNGRVSRCKPCQRAYKVKYYAQNREAVLAYQSEYYQANRESRQAYQVEHYHANKEAIRAHQASNPHVQWEHSARVRAHQHGNDITVERFTREELTEIYGNACWHCGGEFEELDHYPIPISRGGHHVIENCKPSCGPCNQKSWREDPK